MKRFGVRASWAEASGVSARFTARNRKRGVVSKKGMGEGGGEGELSRGRGRRHCALGGFAKAQEHVVLGMRENNAASRVGTDSQHSGGVVLVQEQRRDVDTREVSPAPGSVSAVWRREEPPPCWAQKALCAGGSEGAPVSKVGIGRTRRPLLCSRIGQWLEERARGGGTKRKRKAREVSKKHRARRRGYVFFGAAFVCANAGRRSTSVYGLSARNERSAFFRSLRVYWYSRAE